MGSESDEEPDPMTNPLAASREFVDMLLKLYFTSAISANTFCVLCWWAWKSGMPGSVAEFAMKP